MGGGRAGKSTGRHLPEKAGVARHARQSANLADQSLRITA
jgi:hypothetical protein